jgi:aminopeptidase N
MSLAPHPKERTMIRFPVWLSFAAASLACAAMAPCCAFAAGAEAAEADSLRCRRLAMPPVVGGPAVEPQYAPDRKVDILHLALDVTPDFQKHAVRGEMTMTFKPVGKPLDTLRLDAMDLAVESVTCTAKLAGHQVTGKEIVIAFAEPAPPDRETRLAIRYAAQPAKGLYFRTPENGARAADTHLWSQGESIEARHWFPCHDYPNAKFTSEVTCRVPEGMIVLSNGREASATKDPATGLVAVRWVQEKPHVSYLVALVAGYFTALEDRHRDVPLRFYAPPSDAKEAPASFAGTKEAMAFFEREIGVPFPWAQYGQVVVHDFHFGGMENTTLTTLHERTLHRPETETLVTSEPLMAHELAHQWFGDYVTCKDWSHLWLNEGFATYYEHLFAGHRHGRDELLYALCRDARRIVQEPAASARPIVTRRYATPGEQFDHRAYQKGAWVLHMLRGRLGDALFRRCVKTFLDRHPFGTVVTQDLNAVVEELSGRSFDRFFDQWVHHAHHPELEIGYGWDEKAKLARVSVRQAQPVGDRVPIFHFPLALRFKSKSGVVDHRVEVREKEEDFYVPLPGAPEIVRIDPEFALLAQVRFAPPVEMLYAQLADPTDMVGRLIAAERLADRKDAAAIARLKEALQGDAFYGVRIEAAESLRKIHTDDALDALIDSRAQPDARVRNAVAGALAGFYHPRALEALRKVLETERNPGILATALRGLGPYPQAAVRDALRSALAAESYRHRLAEAAADAMRAQDDPAYLAPLREALGRRESAFTSHGFAAGLDALGFLARRERSRDAEREFIAGYLHHKRERFRLAAIAALGALEDPKAIPILESLAAAAKETPSQREAEKALAALRAANKPADHLKDLRQELLDLRKESGRLNRELEDVKKRIEAVTPNKQEQKSDK